MNFRQRIQQFMAGRNGYDAFGRFLLFAAVLLMALALVFNLLSLSVLVALCQAMEWAVLIVCIFRVMSRNLYQRQKENAWYMGRHAAFLRWWRGVRERWQQRKDYKFFRCPSCHALLRVPRGKGKLLLTCRKCGNRFERKT